MFNPIAYVKCLHFSNDIDTFGDINSKLLVKLQIILCAQKICLDNHKRVLVQLVDCIVCDFLL